MHSSLFLCSNTTTVYYPTILHYVCPPCLWLWSDQTLLDNNTPCTCSPLDSTLMYLTTLHSTDTQRTLILHYTDTTLHCTNTLPYCIILQYTALHHTRRMSSYISVYYLIYLNLKVLSTSSVRPSQHIYQYINTLFYFLYSNKICQKTYLQGIRK